MSSADVAMRSQLLRVLLALTGATAVVTGGFGALLVVADLAERGEDWDGFGVFLGALLGIPSLVVGLLAWVALRSVRRQLTRARWLGGVAGGLLLWPLLAVGAHWASWLAFFLGAALIGSALLARPRTAPSGRLP